MKRCLILMALVLIPAIVEAQGRGIMREVINQNFNLQTHKLKTPKHTCVGTAPSVSASGDCATYCNSASNKMFQSCNGGAWEEIGSGSGEIGGGTVTQADTDAVADNSFFRYDGTTGNVAQDSDMTENDAGDVTVAGNFATGENSCESNTDCNYLSVYGNVGAATGATCATLGTAGRFMLIDKDVSSAVNVVLCEGTTEASDLSATGSSPGTDSVGTAQLNDGSDNSPAEHECLKVASGAATVKYEACLDTGDVTTTEIANATVSSDDLAAPNKKHAECIYVENPAAEGFDSIWRAPVDVTITEIFCETDANTVAVMFERDDGSAADIQSGVLTCTTGGATTASFSGTENQIADGHKLDLDLSAPGTVAKVAVCFEYTIDE